MYPASACAHAGRVGPVAERHARLGAMVVELHTHDRGLVHPHLRHRVRAQDDQLRFHELEDLVADRELGITPRWTIGAPSATDAQVDVESARAAPSCARGRTMPTPRRGRSRP